MVPGGACGNDKNGEVRGATTRRNSTECPPSRSGGEKSIAEPHVDNGTNSTKNATMPCASPCNSSSHTTGKSYVELHFVPSCSIVSEFVMHGPRGELNHKCFCMKDGECSKYYPKLFQTEKVINEIGFTLYKRRGNGRFIYKK